MTYRSGDIKIKQNIELAAGIPLRSGDVVDTLADLNSIPTIERFAKRPTLVKSEDAYYLQNNDLTTWTKMAAVVNTPVNLFSEPFAGNQANWKGDGTKTVFTTTHPMVQVLAVFVGGVIAGQEAYAFSNTTLTLTTAPLNNELVRVIYTDGATSTTPPGETPPSNFVKLTGTDDGVPVTGRIQSTMTVFNPDDLVTLQKVLDLIADLDGGGEGGAFRVFFFEVSPPDYVVVAETDWQINDLYVNKADGSLFVLTEIDPDNWNEGSAYLTWVGLGVNLGSEEDFPVAKDDNGKLHTLIEDANLIKGGFHTATSQADLTPRIAIPSEKKMEGMGWGGVTDFGELNMRSFPITIGNDAFFLAEKNYKAHVGIINSITGKRSYVPTTSDFFSDFNILTYSFGSDSEEPRASRYKYGDCFKQIGSYIYFLSGLDVVRFDYTTHTYTVYTCPVSGYLSLPGGGTGNLVSLEQFYVYSGNLIITSGPRYGGGTYQVLTRFNLSSQSFITWSDGNYYKRDANLVACGVVVGSGMYTYRSGGSTYGFFDRFDFSTEVNTNNVIPDAGLYASNPILIGTKIYFYSAYSGKISICDTNTNTTTYVSTPTDTAPGNEQYAKMQLLGGMFYLNIGAVLYKFNPADNSLVPYIDPISTSAVVHVQSITDFLVTADKAFICYRNTEAAGGNYLLAIYNGSDIYPYPTFYGLQYHKLFLSGDLLLLVAPGYDNYSYVRLSTKQRFSNIRLEQLEYYHPNMNAQESWFSWIEYFNQYIRNAGSNPVEGYFTIDNTVGTNKATLGVVNFGGNAGVNMAAEDVEQGSYIGVVPGIATLQYNNLGDPNQASDVSVGLDDGARIHSISTATDESEMSVKGSSMVVRGRIGSGNYTLPGNSFKGLSYYQDYIKLADISGTSLDKYLVTVKLMKDYVAGLSGPYTPGNGDGSIVALVAAGQFPNTTDAAASNILGGVQNSMDAASDYSSILGGSQNEVVSSTYSAVLSGSHNIITASDIGGTVFPLAEASLSAILSGGSNTIEASDYAAILAGFNNYIYAYCHRSLILSGSGNRIGDSNATSSFTDTVIVNGANVVAAYSNTAYVDNLAIWTAPATDTGTLNALVYDPTTKQVKQRAISGGSSLPSQTGNGGKFLSTNGTVASWSATPGVADGNKGDVTTSGSGATWAVNSLPTSRITGLDTALANKLAAASNLSDLSSAATARTNLGLGSLATQSGTFSGSSSGTNTGDETSTTILTKIGNGTKIGISYLPDAVVGAMNYQGTYNASTNSPTLGAASSANKGYYYIVTTAGTQFSTAFDIGDWIASDGTSWDKIDNTDALVSFNGRIGAISLLSGDVTSALGYTPLSSVGGSITGTAGAGYIGLIPQSSIPATPASGIRLYARSTGAFSWVGTNGFERSFIGTGITANRAYTLPDADGVLALFSQIPTNNNALTNGAGYLVGTANLSDLASATTARSNLGLGTLATQSEALTSTVAGEYGLSATNSSANASAVATHRLYNDAGSSTALFQNSSAATLASYGGISTSGLGLFLAATNASAPVRVYLGGTAAANLRAEWLTNGNYQHTYSTNGGLIHSINNSNAGTSTYAGFSVLNTGSTTRLETYPSNYVTTAFQGKGLLFNNNSGLIIGSASITDFAVGTTTNYMGRFSSVGLKVGNNTSPTARLHIVAGSATANTAPIKLTNGTNLTTPEAGAVEYDGTNFFATNSTAVRYTVVKSVTATATLDFPSTSAQSSSDLTIAVTDAALGDVVSVGVPNASVLGNSDYTAWVSAAGTVTVRFNNYSAAALDPASGTFRVSVLRY